MIRTSTIIGIIDVLELDDSVALSEFETSDFVSLNSSSTLASSFFTVSSTTLVVSSTLLSTACSTSSFTLSELAAALPLINPSSRSNCVNHGSGLIIQPPYANYNPSNIILVYLYISIEL
jgi:hypothetical protein